jgi:hypothetical protein
MKLWAVEHIHHHFWVGLLLHPPKSDKKKCSTAQSFICKDATSYKICILAAMPKYQTAELNL